MKGVNKVIVVGHMGDDPKCNQFDDGGWVCNVNIATSRSWKDKNTGEKKEATEWHRTVAYRRTAEIMRDYLHKGSKVYIEGSLRTRKWQSDSGENHYSTEIIVDHMQMLDSKGETSRPEPAPKAASAYEQAKQLTPEDGFDDDIPF